MKILSVLFLACVLFTSNVWAAAFDVAAHNQCATDLGCTTSTTLNVAITLGAGANRQLGVFTFISCSGGHTAPTVTGVTYNGTSLIQKASKLSTSINGYFHTWPTGSQPTSGANTVTATISGPLIAGNCVTQGSFEVSAVSATGVHQSTTLSSVNTNSGTGTALTVTISSSGANDLGIQAACQGTGFTSTTQTSIFTTSGGATACGTHAGARAGGGVTAFDWTASGSDSWQMIGAAFKDVNAFAPSSSPMIFSWRDYDDCTSVATYFYASYAPGSGLLENNLCRHDR